MSYVYTALPMLDKKIQNPEYAKRNIKGYTSGRLDTIHIMGIPIERQLAYAPYVQNLPAFLYATNVQTKVVASKVYYSLKANPNTFVVFPLPHLTISPLKPSKTDDDRSNFMQALGEVNSEHVKFRGMDTFVIRNPTISIVQSLPVRQMIVNTPSSPDATSLAGMKQYLISLKILTYFLATHSYPAFMSPDQEVTSFKKSWESFTSGAGSYGFSTLHNHDGQTFAPLGFSDVVLPANETVDGCVVDENSSVKEYHKHTSGPGDQVAVAKPAPFYPTINIGSAASIPSLPGYVLPYFHGAIEPSKDALISIFKRYFYGNMGDSQESAAKGWAEWCKGVDSWYKTSAGMALTHVFYGVQLALEAQGRIYLIMNGTTYLGCAILGYKMVLGREGDTLVPGTPEIVRTLALKLDDHTHALDLLITLCRELTLSGDEMDVDKTEKPKSTRALYWEVTKAAKLMGEDEYETCQELVERIAFPEKYWPITKDTIVRALKLISDPTLPIPNEWPMYLSSSRILDTSREHQVLSLFGPLAPSFVDSNGTEFEIPKGVDAADPYSIYDPGTQTRQLDAILVSGKKLDVAVNDLLFVVKRRKIRQNFMERASGYRTIRYRGIGRDEIWSALKSLPYKVEGDLGGKRKASEGPDEKTVEKKRKKDTEAAASLDFSGDI